jgi:hypothetical protein
VYIPTIIVYFAIYSTINNNARYLASAAVASLGCNTAYDGSCLPKFRDSLSVPPNDQAVSLLNMGKQLQTRIQRERRSQETIIKQKARMHCFHRCQINMQHYKTICFGD